MTHEFKHPKFYTELRKRNKSDQAISNSYAIKDSSDKLERATGPGLKLQAQCNSQEALQSQLRASSSRDQAPSTKRQAASKPEPTVQVQASSAKRQASQPE